MKSVHALLISVVLALSSLAPFARAATVAPASPGAVDRGWFYFDDPKPADDEPAASQPQATPPSTQPQKPKEDKCKKKDTWDATCGFVNPGEDFEFQAKERDALLERMTVAQNDPKAVEAFQYYMHWVLERTSQVTNLWWYNMTQNPELDPSASQPISAMGLRLMTDVRKGTEREVFDMVRDEGGLFVFFSRSDCEFCHQMAEPLRMLADRTGLPVRNASLDAQCLPQFKDGCMTAPDSVGPAQALQVATVPTVFLYVRPNTWIRIATGIADTESMAQRSMQFFSAYRSALLKGVDNGVNGRPSVDFGFDGPTGNKSTGLTSPGEGKPMTLPTEDDVARMLGEKK